MVRQRLRTAFTSEQARGRERGPPSDAVSTVGLLHPKPVREFSTLRPFGAVIDCGAVSLKRAAELAADEIFTRTAV